MSALTTPVKQPGLGNELVNIRLTTVALDLEIQLDYLSQALNNFEKQY